MATYSQSSNTLVCLGTYGFSGLNIVQFPKISEG